MIPPSNYFLLQCRYPNLLILNRALTLLVVQRNGTIFWEYIQHLRMYLHQTNCTTKSPFSSLWGRLDEISKSNSSSIGSCCRSSRQSTRSSTNHKKIVGIFLLHYYYELRSKLNNLICSHQEK